MNLREIVQTVGIPIVVLSHQSGVSRFKLYQFMNAYGDLREDEQQAVLGALLAHGQRVEQALGVLRQVASA